MSTQRIKILLIEDESAHAELVCRSFESYVDRFDITVAGTLNEAIAHIEKSIPNLVISDFLLPDGKGTELLKQKDDNQKFPVVIMTSHGNEMVAVEALKAGALDYVVKSDTTLLDMPHIAARALRQWDQITGRKLAEKALQESEENFRMLIELSPVAMLISDKRQKPIHLNKKFIDLFGYTLDDLSTAEKWWQLAYPDINYRNALIDQWNRKIEIALENEIEPMESKVICKNGILRHVEFRLSSIGKRNLIVFNDLTERKKAEEEKQKLEAQLRQSQKMEAVGTLAGGIAHDFNNILGIILGNVEMAMTNTSSFSLVQTNLKEIRIASLRARDVIRQLLSYSRKSDQERKPHKINPIIKESLNLLRSSIPTSIDIRQNIHDESGTILADITQIHQVIINLCINAAHAMLETGGTIEVRTQSITIDKDTSTQYNALYPGRYVKLTIRDTGHGIDPEIKDRIFDPYFTTKDVDEGTGMGLAVVYGIIKHHDGAIHVTSEPGTGTTINVFFPLADTKPIKIEAQPSESIPRGKEHILIVDDERMLLEMMQKMLEYFDYKTTAYTDSIQALKAFHSHKDRYDLVITDMTMPIMNGEQFAEKLRTIDKKIPIIICSGFNDLISQERARSIGIHEYIVKPIEMKELAKTVRKVLDKSLPKHRKHGRFKVKEGAVVQLTTDPSKQGQIIDISKGGLAFCYAKDKKWEDLFFELTIKTPDNGFSLDKIPCKKISNVNMLHESPFRQGKKNRCGVRFETLTHNQINGLEFFIQNYTISKIGPGLNIQPNI